VRHFFDTTVLVAAVLEEHRDHFASFRALSSATRTNSFCAAHSVAEMFATLTRIPGKQRLSAEQSLLAIGAVEDRLTAVSLDATEYFAAVRKFAAIGVIGGTIYDGLIGACALKSKADVIYTWNVAHFLLLGSEVAQKVRTP
jgi:predicted nucleic acid-binding protein